MTSKPLDYIDTWTAPAQPFFPLRPPRPRTVEPGLYGHPAVLNCVVQATLIRYLCTFAGLWVRVDMCARQLRYRYTSLVSEQQTSVVNNSEKKKRTKAHKGVAPRSFSCSPLSHVLLATAANGGPSCLAERHREPHLSEMYHASTAQSYFIATLASALRGRFA